MNSITDEGDNIAYYGILTKIIELMHPEVRSVILFECNLVYPIRGIKQDEYGFTLVNLKSHWRRNEPCVLGSQPIQVFYTPELKEKNWHMVIATKLRDLFEREDVMLEVDLL